MASAGVKVGGGVESKGFGTAVAGFSFRAPRISIFARAAGRGGGGGVERSRGGRGSRRVGTSREPVAARGALPAQGWSPRGVRPWGGGGREPPVGHRKRPEGPQPAACEPPGRWLSSLEEESSTPERVALRTVTEPACSLGSGTCPPQGRTPVRRRSPRHSSPTVPAPSARGSRRAALASIPRPATRTDAGWC
eukprot:scaffold3961_cov95-Isochrysis_galbana.AAC.3